MNATRSLRPEHRRYLAVETGLSVVLNVLVSAAFAWVPFRGAESVPLWSQGGPAVDLVPTTFMVTLMVSIALTLLTRRRVRAGVVPGLNPAATHYAWVMHLPCRAVWRALALAVGLTAVLVPVLVGLFVALGIDSLPFASFFVSKLLYGGVLAILVTPVILVAALADSPNRS